MSRNKFNKIHFAIVIALFAITSIQAQEIITINYNNNLGPMLRPASGLLNPFTDNGSLPAESDMADVFAPLNIKYIRTQNIVNHYRKAGNSPTMIHSITHRWGNPGSSTTWNPTAMAPWEDWTAFESVMRERAVQLFVNNNLSPIYTFWNEPDAVKYFMGYTGATYPLMFETFKRMYKMIKEVDPYAKISGLGFQNINSIEMQNNMKDFISYCVANNCVPDYWDWHFGGSNMKTQVDLIRAHCATLNVHGNIGIYEYLNSKAVIYPGRNAWQMAMIEESDVKIAARAQWGIELAHNRGSLSGLLMNDGKTKRGTWWVMKHYGQMEGVRLGYSASTDRLKVVSNYNETDKSSHILLGNKFSDNNGDLGYTGSVEIILEGITSSNNQINISLHEIPYNNDFAVNDLGAPIINQAYTIDSNNRVSFNFNWTDQRNAYQIVVTNISPVTTSVRNATTDKQSTIIVYPNPVENNNLHIKKIEGTVVRLYNANGQMMYNKNSNNADLIIDTRDWGKGIYFLSVTKDNEMINKQRIIIK